MKPPRLIYRKQVASLVGDQLFLAGVKRDIDRGIAVKQGLEGKFGALLMVTIENIERELYLKVIDKPAWRIFDQIRWRAELSAIQYLKARLLAYVENGETLYQEMDKEYE
jgi:hypothetical protein